MFYFPISHQEVASQIAKLINSYNSLSTQRTTQGILSSKTKYVVETHGRFVIGVAGVEKTSYQMSELKHMVVHPSWRGKGVGQFIGRRALDICDTPVIYATVRTSNSPSMKTMEKLGFNRVEEFASGDHNLAVLVRIAPKWNKHSSSKSSLLTEPDWLSLTPLSTVS
ncbi:MAG: GNAT family N-acetyltransferase [Candidatus Altiarchaeales archaeon]|nr:GNAT family N-acetyltransferase [Candidatus Altiarchaeales archaeon]